MNKQTMKSNEIKKETFLERLMKSVIGGIGLLIGFRSLQIMGVIMSK